MKKVLAIIAVAALATSAFSGSAIAAKKKKAKPVRQEVSGHIISQAPPADHTSNPTGCYAGAHRRVAVASDEAEQANGIIGYHFDVDKRTWGKKFRLANVTEGVDIDIYYYTEFGTREQVFGDTAYSPPSVIFTQRDTDGEHGKVPAKMNKAIVCMKSGTQADFTYTAGAGVK